MRLLDILYINTLRSLKLWLRFRVSFATSIVAMIANIAIFFFLGMAFGNAANSAVAIYGTTFFSFVLVGIAFNQYALMAVNDYLRIIRTAYFSNWMEILLSSRTMGYYLLSTIVWSFILTTFNLILYLVFGVFLFGANLIFPPNWWMIFVILFLTIISLSGIGLLGAAVFLRGAKGDLEPITWLTGIFAALVAGVYYPIEKLPAIVQTISKFLPHTYALRGGRLILLQGAGGGEIFSIIVYLALFSIVLFPLGYFLFIKSLKKAEREGTLVRWA